jgi:DNA primase
MASVFEIARGINIRTVYEKYTGESLNQYRQRGNISCPFHTDAKPSFHLYDKTNSFYCFSCKKSGSTIDLYKEIMGVVDDYEAAKQLCDDFGLSYDVYQPNPAYQDYIEVYKFVAGLYNFFLHTKACPNPNYFKDRGLDKVEKEYLLGYCPSILIDRNNQVISFKKILMDKFPTISPAILDSYNLYDSRGDSIMAGRYVFTIFDNRGNPVAFSGRTTDPDNPAKYYNTSETTFFKKRFTLYNYHKAKKFGQVYVVEGYCDALSLITLGFENVVASMGTSFTSDHLSLLKEKDIVLSLDNDSAGRTQMAELIKQHKHTPFKVLTWEGAKDFNELLMLDPVKLKVTFVKPNLVSAPEYLISYLKDTLDLSLLVERDKLWIELASLIGANDKRYLSKYPINTTYTPVSYDYYWTIVKRIVKGKRGK